ncbi:nitrite reductase large subunit NirB [Pseudoxanthomonas sangjuensis]|uniref:nitrite reductase large subunit NirB n=1 Tax=Pseudoxanthomonas sangjuensis TaxID=1503750 RepID=UPI001478C2B4|nr:nitrite reductase large subunit NirB [Pseudoxanthomonas sangjuensis]
MKKMKIVVVGNGMVGHRFVEELVAKQLPGLEIVVLGEESRPAYDRVHLSAFFAGGSAQELSLVKPGFYEREGIELRLGAKAVAVDRQRRKVKLASGETIGYDKLVLATGSYPFVPPVPGRDREGCFVYRTIDDLEAMAAWGAKSKTGVVVGGGLLGLEAAKALKDMGLQTHVVEFAPRLMAVQVDDGGGRVLRAKIEALGVAVHTGKNTVEIVDGAGLGVGGRHAMKFLDGGQLEADMIVFSAGIRPRDELARNAALPRGERGGVVIDDRCRTADHDIYAIGECAVWEGRLFGLVAPGYEMARVAVDDIAATGFDRAGCGESRFGGADTSTKLKLMGVDVASIGDAHGATPDSRICQYSDERRQVYKKLVLSACGRRLLGAVLVGEAEEYGTLLQMVLNRIELPESPEFLILPSADGAARPGLGAEALPDAAQVCSCNNVSKGQIRAAVRDGAASIGAIKKCTRAGSSCGGCVPLATQVMKAEMSRLGMTVNNHVCEHFPFSRQELYHLVRVGKIRTFDELIGRHGRGLGCDVCKPAVASILASCWNAFVLEKDKAGLQDSNDYFLANIQKDGTYSVVPRIAGGEIAPDKLIAIGEVARKYGLYTKITGGQRIDLFGAQVHQLPLIWQELVDAGFESGHAYGKALRTVKSCVGSTWCRYGMLDSVSMALAIEHRYKGLRAPHKLKSAVSGCTRECAEAQSKDFGVIATENGWNLYVCGNGGMKPRHAELLAGDLDDETLIRYIDRFLMFYIRTADRLQRTSVWRDNLEGGLDYLKDVVVHDRLGLGAELEAEMSQVVGSYACEWKRAIEDPETLRRFRTFVNADGGDENVAFVRERGQIRPARAAEKRARAIDAVLAGEAAT